MGIQKSDRNTFPCITRGGGTCFQDERGAREEDAKSVKGGKGGRLSSECQRV